MLKLLIAVFFHRRRVDMPRPRTCARTCDMSQQQEMQPVADVQSNAFQDRAECQGKGKAGKGKSKRTAFQAGNGKSKAVATAKAGKGKSKVVAKAKAGKGRSKSVAKAKAGKGKSKAAPKAKAGKGKSKTIAKAKVKSIGKGEGKDGKGKRPRQDMSQQQEVQPIADVQGTGFQAAEPETLTLRPENACSKLHGCSGVKLLA